MLLYHGIDDVGGNRLNTRVISKGMFEQHLAYFKEHFHTVSLDEYFDAPAHPEKLTITITFDDGYRNNLTHALPLLEKYECPASFFITGIRDAGYDILWADLVDLVSHHSSEELAFSGLIFVKDRKGRFVDRCSGKTLKQFCKDSGWRFKHDMMPSLFAAIDPAILEQTQDYWLQMTTSEIRELSASPWATIGSHGYYHNNLDAIDLSSAEEELEHTRQFLEAATGTSISALAFPCGLYTREVLKMCNQLGYNKLLAVDYLFDDDYLNPHLVERIGINPYIGVTEQMAAILKGTYY
ncbi:Uncharacterised protein [BD1-7 clade bacterium]|uniref:NodB homology domain-containing protein n=1 Tax=BD1-7 clade bacterium TaxID=2029982 RepID=A0A5S9PCV5_9GAMM|nr:Uncharacterised protein [BD1-7 clade bacterium]CAA0101366.1 Uncharacterised protein [BD1-7 clade bacterium]